MSCLGKLFSSILNLRLKQYVIENNILREEQLGFREGNRTSDALITLYSLIQQYCHQNGQKLFSCFVDFKKAFDSIPRDLLFEKLLQLGVNGKFFNAIKTMYTNDNCCVRVGEKITNTFLANQGVKQGCILSPLLFNIFLSDLPKIFLGPECQPAKLNNAQPVSCLVWADDVVLLSESNKGIQEMISKLAKYSSTNYLEINVEKTKGMIFNKSGRFNRMTYKLNNQFIHTTNSYKYLGFIMTPSGEINSGLKDLKVRALRAYYKLKRKLGYLFRRNISTTLFLFDALIKPILLYASDFWGCLKMPKNNPIENVQIRFYKDILGVQKQTTNVGVLMELGEIPITIYAKKNCIKNYLRITFLKRANNILTASVQTSTVSGSPWLFAIKDCLDRIGIGTIQNELIHQKAFVRMKDIFHQETFTDMKRIDSKLRTFWKIKTNIGIEKYLLNTIKIDERTAISKLRLSNHDLMIEKGRHLKIDKSQRFCPFCPDLIETEHHFMLCCKTFKPLRAELLNKVENILPYFNRLSEHEKFITLLANERIADHVGNYIQKALFCRRFLLNKPKNYI